MSYLFGPMGDTHHNSTPPRAHGRDSMYSFALFSTFVRKFPGRPEQIDTLMRSDKLSGCYHAAPRTVDACAMQSQRKVP